MKVCWISAGVSSFISAYLSKDVDEYIYIDIDDQHPDSTRFIKDCEKALGKPIKILKSEYASVENVIRKNKYINGPSGAPCTKILKKKVRQQWENEHKEPLTYVWGFDVNEKKRAERIKETYFEFQHEFPLIENSLTKEDAHGMLQELGIQRPMMYDLGYSNNNCIGCVKGGMGYWNKIRVDFPGVFEKRARLEREIGASCIRGVYLDELDPNRGNTNEVIPECSLLCETAMIRSKDDNSTKNR